MPLYHALNLNEIDSLLENVDPDTEEVSITIIPPDPDDLTDEEEFDENELDEIEVRNVPGELEVNVEEDESDVDEREDTSSDEVPTRKRKTNDKSKIKNKTTKKANAANKEVPKCKWEKKMPVYTQTAADSKDNITNNPHIQRLYGKSPTEVFMELFDEDVLEMIRHESIMYARSKNNHDFRIDTEELKVFLAILMFSGYHRLPSEEMYWETARDAGIPLVYEAMSRNRFRLIKRFLHICDNERIDRTDKFYKVRQYFDMMNDNFMKFGVFKDKLAIDEMMVRYYGKHSGKMFMKGKPIKFGYKCWCLATSDGYLLQFHPYGGKENSAEKELEKRVIKKLASVIPDTDIENHELYFDNFFTSADTLAELKEMKLKATGTVRATRINKCPIMEADKMKKTTERVHYDYRFDTKNEILVVRWHDNKAVTIATNHSSVEPLAQAKRFSQAEKKMVNVNMPKVFDDYNSSMGGVDLVDKQVSLYRVRIRSKNGGFLYSPNLLM